MLYSSEQSPFLSPECITTHQSINGTVRFTGGRKTSVSVYLGVKESHENSDSVVKEESERWKIQVAHFRAPLKCNSLQNGDKVCCPYGWWLTIWWCKNAVSGDLFSVIPFPHQFLLSLHNIPCHHIVIKESCSDSCAHSAPQQPSFTHQTWPDCSYLSSWTLCLHW